MEFPQPPNRVLPWSRALDVVLHHVEHNPEGGLDLTVSFGELPARAYRAVVDTGTPGVLAVTFDEPLFFGLSEWSVRRYANAALYQMELGAIADAFTRGDTIPALPARLGTTAFAERLSISRLVKGHVRRLLYRWHLLEPKTWTHPDYRPGGPLDPRRPENKPLE